MPYPQQEPQSSIVVVFKVKDVQQLRHWLRQEILAGPAYESVSEFLFEAYQKLGEVRSQ